MKKKKQREKFVLSTILVFSYSVRFGSICITFFMLGLSHHLFDSEHFVHFHFENTEAHPTVVHNTKEGIIMYKRNDKTTNRYHYAGPTYIQSHSFFCQRQWNHHQSPRSLSTIPKDLAMASSSLRSICRH